MVSAVPPPVGGPKTQGRGNGGPGNWFGNVHRAVTSVFEGLSVTMSWMFRRPMTIQYPDKIDRPIQETLPEAYRGILELDVRLCTGCLLCEKTCPIQCISVGVEKNAAGGRDIVKFDIDVDKCMYCGLCQESCNFGALRHSAEFEATQSSIANLNLHFVTQPTPVARHKAGEAPARLPRGEILKNVIPGYGTRPGKLPGAATAPVARPVSAPVAPPVVPPAAEATAPIVEAPKEATP